MIVFLLICIILLMFKPVRSLVGIVFWIIIAAWAYGHYLAPHPTGNGAAVTTEPAVIEQASPPKASPPAEPNPPRLTPARPFIQR